MCSVKVKNTLLANKCTHVLSQPVREKFSFIIKLHAPNPSTFFKKHVSPKNRGQNPGNILDSS